MIIIIIQIIITVYAQSNTQNPLGLWHTNGSPNLIHTTRHIIINRKMRTCKIVDFAVPPDQRLEWKVNEKKNKYLDITRELKKLWNMKVTFMPIMIGALGTVTRRLIKGLEDLEIKRKNSDHPNWDRPEYCEGYWRLEKTCCHLDSDEKPSTKTEVKNSQGVNNHKVSYK